jgi:hypothetical protein
VMISPMIEGRFLWRTHRIRRRQDDRKFLDPSRKIGPQVSAALLKRGVIGRAMP